VRHDYHRHALAFQDLKRAHERLIALVVEVRVRLVQHHETRRAVQGTGERDALALPRRERLPRFADLGVVALGGRG
jgi:hypothetical protein